MNEVVLLGINQYHEAIRFPMENNLFPPSKRLFHLHLHNSSYGELPANKGTSGSYVHKVGSGFNTFEENHLIITTLVILGRGSAKTETSETPAKTFNWFAPRLYHCKFSLETNSSASSSYSYTACPSHPSYVAPCIAHCSPWVSLQIPKIKLVASDMELWLLISDHSD